MNNPYMYPNTPNAYPTQMNIAPTQMCVGQIQNGGFVSIASEDMVNSYPVAPGNCVRFKVEGKPILIEKTVGFSQLDDPQIKRYRLIEEGVEPEKAKATKEDIDSVFEEIGKIKSGIEKMWDEIDVLKVKKTRRNTNGED